MSYPVKYTHSAMLGAPTISGTAGAMIAALDALLIDGFNVQPVQGISVTSNEATVTFASQHGFEPGQIVLISGATPEALNGEHYVTWADTTSFKFSDISGVADGAASGTISCKVAPVGQWEKAFSGTNKAVYRSQDVVGTRLYLRVDDTTTTYASVRMYESMTDVDTGLGASTVYYWRKSDAASTATRGWRMVGDSRLFYLGVRWSASYPAQHGINSFGDFISFKAGDAYACWLHGDFYATATQVGEYNVFYAMEGNENYPAEVARSYTQTGSPIKVHKVGSKMCNFMGIYGPDYPSPVDNGLLLHSPVVLRQGVSSSDPARGTLPGVLQPVQTKPLSDGNIVTDIQQLPGRSVLMVSIAYNANECRAAFDITGPWR